MGKYLTPLGFVVTVAGIAWLIAPALPQMIRDFRDGDDSVRRLVKFLGIWLIGIGMMLSGIGEMIDVEGWLVTKIGGWF